MKKVVKTAVSFLAGYSILFSQVAKANDADDRYVYVGAKLGVSEPVVKTFTDKETRSKFRLKQSRLVGGRIGYSFYPNMMVELHFTHKPKYGLTYMLPESDTGIVHPFLGALTIPRTPGSTKVSSSVYTINLLYQFEPQFMELKPYVSLGAGIARLSVKSTTTATSIFQSAAGINVPTQTEYFRIKKDTSNYLAWQIGGGISKDLTPNISLDLGAKLQVVNNIKLKYDTLNGATGLFESQKPIKKTIGVGEFTLGVTFKIPV